MVAVDTLTHELDSRGVATITLDRPDRHNALNRHSIDELNETLAELSSRCRLLIVTGAGKSFCAGADVGWMRESVNLSTDDNRADALLLSDALQALDTFPVPTIARIQGAAIGGGAGLVSCCDVAIAAETAMFAFSEVRLGLIPATISPYVVAAIGPRQARRYFLTAERFDSHTACRIGLVHQVVPGDGIDASVATVVEALLSGAPCAQHAARVLISDVSHRAIDTRLREGLATRLATLRAGPEAQEGLGAFSDKREPDWR